MKSKKATKAFVIFLIVVVSIILFLLKPFNINPSGDILVTVVPIPSNSVQITILNNSDSSILFSNAYYIEEKTLFYWHKASLLPTSFTSLGHELKPGESYSATLNYESIYGVLSPGQYRLVKNFKYNDDSSYFAGYFIIE